MEKELKVLHKKIMTIFDSLFLFRQSYTYFGHYPVEINGYVFDHKIDKKHWDIRVSDPYRRCIIDIYQFFTVGRIEYRSNYFYINYIPPFSKSKKEKIKNFFKENQRREKGSFTGLIFKKLMNPNFTNYFINPVNIEWCSYNFHMSHTSPSQTLPTFLDIKRPEFFKTIKRFSIEKIFSF